jgi:hypothetical protein
MTHFEMNKKSFYLKKFFRIVEDARVNTQKKKIVTLLFSSVTFSFAAIIFLRSGNKNGKIDER